MLGHDCCTLKCLRCLTRLYVCVLQQCRQQQELIMKFLQQSQQQSVSGGAGWSGSQAGALSLGKATGKSMGLLELEAERLHKQQQQRAQQQQRVKTS